jgi:hypothetical protein
MTTKFCFSSGGTCGIAAEIEETPLGDGNRLEITGRKPADAIAHSSAFPAGSLDVERRDQVEMTALLPFIAVVLTVGGPVVYEWTKNISSHNHETQDYMRASPAVTRRTHQLQT